MGIYRMIHIMYRLSVFSFIPLSCKNYSIRNHKFFEDILISEVYI